MSLLSSAMYPSPLLLLCRPLTTSCHMMMARGANSSLTKLGEPNRRMWKNEGNPLNDPAGPMSANDRVATHVRNRNPMNLERMRIGQKPKGFELDRKEVHYWNKLELSISQQHTTAEVSMYCRLSA